MKTIKILNSDTHDDGEKKRILNGMKLEQIDERKRTQRMRWVNEKLKLA